MLRRKVKIANTQIELDKQADAFLKANGFPVSPAYQRMFGIYIQGLPEDATSFIPKDLVKRINKALANEHAFYLIYPEKRPNAEEKDVTCGSEVASPTKEMV